MLDTVRYHLAPSRHSLRQNSSSVCANHVDVYTLHRSFFFLSVRGACTRADVCSARRVMLELVTSTAVSIRVA